jgi:transposase-like protein
MLCIKGIHRISKHCADEFSNRIVIRATLSVAASLCSKTDFLGLKYRNISSAVCSLPGVQSESRVNAKQGFREFQAARRTIQGYEAIHMIRKGQARWVAGDDLLRQIQFIDNLFELAA